MSFSLCPLDPWLAKLSGQSAGLDIGALHHWQMERLRRTVRRAAEKSPHYRESFAQLPPDLHQAVLRGEFPRNFEDMALLPFSSAERFSGCSCSHGNTANFGNSDGEGRETFRFHGR